jgi:hypothetical protein
MHLEQLVMFFLGIVLIIVGAGLLLWVNLQRRAHAGAMKDGAELFNAFANMFRALGELLGADPAAKAGGFLVVAGGLLVAGAFLI